MSDEDQFSDQETDPFAPRPKRPWFGRKPYGYVYGPRTWQGWLVTLVLVIFAMTMAAVSKGDGSFIAVGIVTLVAVPFIIIAVQQRR
jgi:hypothetical protein